MDSYVRIKEEGKVAKVMFYHPKSNSLTSKMLDALASEVGVLGKRGDLNVISLESEGEIFCAGASFNELLEISTVEEGEQFFLGFAKVILAIKSARALVLVKVQGKAVGGAVGLIAAADFVMCSEHAKIRLSELTVGIGPFVISPVIKSKISKSSFMHLALSPKLWFDAKWCSQNGLVNISVRHEILDFEFDQKVEELSFYNTIAVQSLKAEEKLGSLKSEMHRLAAISGELVTNDETRRILKTFIDR